MIISNSFKNYTQNQLKEMTSIIQRMNEKMKEATDLLLLVQQTKEKSKENIIFINTKIKAKYDSLLTTPLQFHQIVEIYKGWHDEFLELIENNVGNFGNKKVLDHIVQIMGICKTFIMLVQGIKE